jgi:uncharacterized protein YkwD
MAQKSAKALARWPLLLAPFALLLAALALTTNPAPTQAYTNCNVANPVFDSVEQQFLVLLNQYRGQNGLQPLTASVNLNRMAAWLAEDQANNNYMGHTDSLGRPFEVRIGQCDIQYYYAGENVAAGYVSAQSVLDGWKGSPGHNAAMLNPSFRQIGIGRAYNPQSYYGYYWATDFSSVDDGTRMSGGVSPSATPTRTPTRTPTPVPYPASMKVPSSGSKVTGPSFTFEWNAQPGADAYRLYVGTTKGSKNLYGVSTGLATRWTARNIPTNGSKIYVRLWTQHNGVWYYKDYSYYTTVK